MLQARSRILLYVGFCAVLVAGCGGEDPGESAADSNAAFLQAVRLEAVGSSGENADAIDTSDAPKIVLQTELFEMGVISLDGLAHAEMEVYNKGTEALHISRVTTSCGCTTGVMRDRVIQPGETGILEITVDPNRIPGFYALKTLTLFNDDPANPYATVDVETHLAQEAELNPKEFRLGEFAMGEGAEQVIRLVQVNETPLEIKAASIREQSPYVSVEFEELPADRQTTPGKREYLITATISPDVPPGRIRQIVYVDTNLKRQPRMSIPLVAEVRGVYTIARSGLSIRDALVGKTYKNVMTISSDKPLEILDFKNSNSLISVTHRPGPEPNTYVFDLVPTKRQGSRLQRDTWTIRLRADGKEYTETLIATVVLQREM